MRLKRSNKRFFTLEDDYLSRLRPLVSTRRCHHHIIKEVQHGHRHALLEVSGYQGEGGVV